MKRWIGVLLGVSLLAACGGAAYAGGKSGVDGTLDVSVVGTVPISGPVAVTGTFWQTTQPVSAASLPLPTGAATSALQTTINATLGSPMQATGGTVSLATVMPAGAVEVYETSYPQANASAVAALAAVAGKTNYLTGFQMTASGATAGQVVQGQIGGISGVEGAMFFAFVIPAGVLVQATPLVVTFPFPIRASGANVAITVTLPAAGAGNTFACVNAQGYRL